MFGYRIVTPGGINFGDFPQTHGLGVYLSGVRYFTRSINCELIWGGP
jgi:hypothetical protein